MDEEFDNAYRFERRLASIFQGSAVLAVIISCMGILGLASLSAQRRTKEIGIRKVLGASSLGLVRMMGREFIILVAAANLLAWPVVYWLMSRWLENFAYRTNLVITPFLMAAALSISATLAAVGYRSWMAATANPVEALRYE